MRPIRRGPSPIAGDFSPYTQAQAHLVTQLGPYCSYCERRVATQLAVEHIQPKGLPAYAHLIGRWDNYLLACVNCNACKKDKDVVLSDILLPDRDNTSVAFSYQPDGKILPSTQCTQSGMAQHARNTLALTGLDKPSTTHLDPNSRYVALDRVSQRMEAWMVAEEARADIEASPGNNAVRRSAIRTAQGYGFFSIWMTVFQHDPDMRKRLIQAFPGTQDSGCFDPVTTDPVSPAPNPDDLPKGAKI
ncbi:MAG: HNH endonuclease [Rhodocyclales bacterium]|nr:HNH endonuclease [Rhodocyclales bacterium]